MDDYFFCTLIPTGLILMWGITEQPVSVEFLTKTGEKISLKKPGIVIGKKLYEHNPWGLNLQKDLTFIENFLFP